MARGSRRSLQASQPNYGSPSRSNTHSTREHRSQPNPPSHSIRACGFCHRREGHVPISEQPAPCEAARQHFRAHPTRSQRPEGRDGSLENVSSAAPCLGEQGTFHPCIPHGPGQRLSGQLIRGFKSEIQEDRGKGEKEGMALCLTFLDYVSCPAVKTHLICA